MQCGYYRVCTYRFQTPRIITVNHNTKCAIDFCSSFFINTNKHTHTHTGMTCFSFENENRTCVRASETGRIHSSWNEFDITLTTCSLPARARVCVCIINDGTEIKCQHFRRWRETGAESKWDSLKLPPRARTHTPAFDGVVAKTKHCFQCLPSIGIFSVELCAGSVDYARVDVVKKEFSKDIRLLASQQLHWMRFGWIVYLYFWMHLSRHRQSFKLGLVLPLPPPLPFSLSLLHSPTHFSDCSHLENAWAVSGHFHFAYVHTMLFVNSIEIAREAEAKHRELEKWKTHVLIRIVSIKCASRIFDIEIERHAHGKNFKHTHTPALINWEWQRHVVWVCARRALS